eukprot:1028965-Alexandrium_andersonii.AAC.1
MVAVAVACERMGIRTTVLEAASMEMQSAVTLAKAEAGEFHVWQYDPGERWTGKLLSRDSELELIEKVEKREN